MLPNRRVRSRLSWFCAVSLAWCVAGMATGDWWEVAFPNLDQVLDVLWYEPPSTFYVTSSSRQGGLELIKTTDGGATWESIVQSVDTLSGRCALARTPPNALYRVSGGVQRSTDRGDTWHELVAPGFWDPHDPDQRDLEFRYLDVVVSPTNGDRIAGLEDTAHEFWSINFLDVSTDAVTTVSKWGGALLWAHPESGTSYCIYSDGDDTVFGRLDFDAMEVEHLSAAVNSYCAYGFSSAVPGRMYVATREYWATGDEPVSVYRSDSGGPLGGRGQEPLWDFEIDALRGADYGPRSIAVNETSGMIYLVVSVFKDEARSGVFLSANDGADWIHIGGRKGADPGVPPGHLYFLTGQPYLFMQASQQLYKMPLTGATDVRARGKAPVTWGTMKHGAK